MEQLIRMQERARVVLIDQSSVVLEGLQVALSKSSRILVAGTAHTEQEAVALVRTCQPDVVILDIRVGHASGITLCGVIRESYPNTAVRFFTGEDDRHILQSAILAGAQGYLLKSASEESIVKSVEIVAAGKATIDQRLTPRLLAWVRDGKRTAPRERVENYSNADRRVLSPIAAGQSNKEIARELNITPSAVTVRLRTVYKRLKISRRSEAVRYFVQWEKGLSGRTNYSS
ncbi:response regulator [Candidatus Nitrospira nitrificans]|uniref:Putative Nitrate/nitrite response regulator protein NarL n=1 Tax=Candidatus Nitrospira nitrificans TaxID=1742973 RepID=A0A0S4L7V5_9BACT|nr:response regulator transcription factor [Candidatus Nitrospira nitrificans]CUS32685.1 putative Nitrate/nitrite response regulator protein NarL [Candidatus Nitrospira nitrificans]